MNFRVRLIEKIKQKKSIVCVGLDPDLDSREFPEFLLETKKPKLEFAKMIIDEVSNIVAVIKPNTRYYYINELDQLKSIVKYAHDKDLEVIGDCKENDIGHTMAMAYKKQFNGFDFDSITVNGYFGSEGVIGSPDNLIFKKWFEKGKGLFILIKTSNKSSKEIQDLKIVQKGKNKKTLDQDILFLTMAKLVEEWSLKYDHTIGGVVGITYPEHMKSIRKIFNGILLLPGYGAQGGTAETVINAIDTDRYCIINSSRGIMYGYNRIFKGKYSQEEFAKDSKKVVEKMNSNINKYIKKKLL